MISKKFKIAMTLYTLFMSSFFAYFIQTNDLKHAMFGFIITMVSYALYGIWQL